MSIPGGIYAIGRDEQHLRLTATKVDENTPVVLLPEQEGKNPTQEWDLRVLPNRNVEIRDFRTKKYLGFHSAPHVNEQIVIESDEPREWQLRQSSEPSTFFVVVPGGPVDGQELVLDQSVLRNSPPHVALRPLEESQPSSQAWRFSLFH
ncbi:hypothetical protein BGZ83_009326 [Gryganskiella cystojenkinii]|nr:hypothetical protein BGZ83_009326 [Gryganskiella cystojenkinii]